MYVLSTGIPEEMPKNAGTEKLSMAERNARTLPAAIAGAADLKLILSMACLCEYPQDLAAHSMSLGIFLNI